MYILSESQGSMSQIVQSYICFRAICFMEERVFYALHVVDTKLSIHLVVPLWSVTPENEMYKI